MSNIFKPDMPFVEFWRACSGKGWGPAIGEYIRHCHPQICMNPYYEKRYDRKLCGCNVIQMRESMQYFIDNKMFMIDNDPKGKHIPWFGAKKVAAIVDFLEHDLEYLHYVCEGTKYTRYGNVYRLPQ